MDVSELPYYPMRDFEPLMKGLVIGGVGIVHVFLAQFAVGAGALLCYLQWLAGRAREPDARAFVDGFFKTLVLVSFVLGALSGVAMWLVAIQVSPRTIGLMVAEFHWLWAAEWTLFALEVVAGYCFYRYGPELEDAQRLRLLVLYAVASWLSLFVINGILSWQLTPGGWTESGSLLAGFFNPSFWPSLLFRTVVSLCLAALAACLVVNTMHALSRERMSALIRRFAHLLAPMASMPALGAWYLAILPADSRGWVLGGSAAMSLFLNVAVVASLLIGAYAALGLWRGRLFINAATAALLCALAFGATAGGEFVREGVRKPYTVRGALYSNSITPAEVRRLRATGSVALDPYPLLDAGRYPTDELRRGAKVLRFQCSVCHTLEGVNGLAHLTGAWSAEQLRLNVANLQHTKTFMPPFAGNARDLEALVQLLLWVRAGRPGAWSEEDDAELRARLDRMLEEAGTEAGFAGAEARGGAGR